MRYSGVAGQLCQSGFVEPDRRLPILDRQGSAQQGRFLHHQRQQFIIGEIALPDERAVCLRAFREDVLRTQARAIEDRAQFLYGEPLLEIVAPVERNTLLRQRSLRLLARCSGRVDVEG